MSERIRGSYYDALYKSTYRPTLLYSTTINVYSSMGRPVCVGHVRELCKTAEPIEMRFGAV